LNNKFNINYIDKIIYSYKKNNIKTVQQAIDQEEEFNKKRDLYYQKKYEVKESRYERERRLLQIDDED
jgi:DNA replication protein DnaD